ncbi:hypothetical protein C9374_012287 [Naegleria lovaniensis]|uniref:non-specific serine/threonine protein kinase n=1 Tax=Naegleria lovaniensis TaxID=51637 RepID=A0AA88GD66_NAELO|nr:uncharacterized protein C9374_012287 [Naegleria lovaniensis]KAG2373298.1 hypothetical protein C9374_012287 [Naegleria lovaniensis]
MFPTTISRLLLLLLLFLQAGMIHHALLVPNETHRWDSSSTANLRKFFVRPNFQDFTNKAQQQGGAVVELQKKWIDNNLAPSSFWDSESHHHVQPEFMNCTQEIPCSSVSKALQVMIQLFKSKIIEKLEGKIVLMSMLDGNNIYGKDQCNIQQQDPVIFDHLVIESFNQSKIIFACDKFSIFSYLKVNDMLLDNVDLFQASLVMISDLYAQSIRFHRVNMSQVELLVASWDTYISTHILFTSVDVSNSRFGFNGIPTVSFHNASIWNCNISTRLPIRIDVQYSKFVNSQLFLSPDLQKATNSLNVTGSDFIGSETTIAFFNEIVFQEVLFSEKNQLRLMYSDSASFFSVTAIHSQLYMLLNGVLEVTMQDLQFRSSQLLDDNNVMIEMSACYSATLTNSIFSHNKGVLIRIANTYNFILSETEFSHNEGGPCIMVSGTSSEESSTQQVVSSQFINNTCSLGGCAIQLANTERTLINECEFIQNTATEQSGGALHITHVNWVEMTYNEFIQNNAMISGGAIYAITTNFLLTHSHMQQNSALSKGGAIFSKIMSDSNQSGKITFEVTKNTCYNNTAGFSGGCWFFEDDSSSSLTQTIEQGTNFVNNVAHSFGNSLGMPFRNIKYELVIQYSPEDVTIFKGNNISSIEKPTLYLYPGQSIPLIELHLWNNISEPVSFLETPLSSTLKNPSNALISYRRHVSNSNSTNGVHSHSMQVHNLTISLYSPHDIHSVIQTAFELDKNNQIEILIHIQECPSSATLDMLMAPVSETYSCLPITPIPFGVIIPVVSVVSITLFSVFLLLVFLLAKVLRNVTRKLKRLELKEDAEQRLEKKLLQKHVIIEEGILVDEYDQDEKTRKNDVYNEQTSLLINQKTHSSKSQQKKHLSWIISIDQVDLIRRIAEGANGTVYLASWNGTLVAMKTLKQPLWMDDLHDKDDDEFEKEAFLLSSIRHPNIIQFFGVILTGCKKYMVVEFMEKGSLAQLIYQLRTGSQQLSIFGKIDILLGIAKGMNYLHSMKPRGIIHRDLKPANILLDQNMNAKICDFGLSRMWNSNTAHNSVTTNVGTLFYMSNEMISGMNYNHKTDVYSFGIIMRELFFEETPYFYSSSKFPQSSNSTPSELSSYHALSKVLRGERPLIPFDTNNPDDLREWILKFSFMTCSTRHGNEEENVNRWCEICSEYIQLMKQCWNANNQERPNFHEIIHRLSSWISKK